MNFELIFQQIAAETGITVTKLSSDRIRAGLDNDRIPSPLAKDIVFTEDTRYVDGDWTWDELDQDHLEIIRWCGRNQHWPQRVIPAGVIVESFDEDGLYRMVRATVRSMAKFK